MTPEQIAKDETSTEFVASTARLDGYGYIKLTRDELARVITRAITRALIVSPAFSMPKGAKFHDLELKLNECSEDKLVSKGISTPDYKNIEDMFAAVTKTIEAASDAIPTPNEGLAAVAEQHMILAMADLDKALANTKLAAMHHAHAVATQQRRAYR